MKQPLVRFLLIAFMLSGTSCRLMGGSHTAQQLVGNFFNILVQGAQAVTAKEPEDQINATAGVLNSISNLVQMTMESEKNRMTPDEYDQMHKLSAQIYRALNNLIHDEDFMQALNEHRGELQTELVKPAEVRY